MSKQMPAESRVWIYQGERKFTNQELAALEVRASDFVSRWTSHSKLVKAAFELRYQRFLVLMLDENHVAAGGCSIDSSVHFIREIEKDFTNIMTDRLKFAYKAGNEVEVASKGEFEKFIADGIITDETIVFNNLVLTKGALESEWEIPFGKSWHRQFFTAKV